MEKQSQADGAIRSWYNAWSSEVSEAKWKSPKDLLASYPSATLVGPSQYRFTASPKVYLDVHICFERHLACIISVSEEVV